MIPRGRLARAGVTEVLRALGVRPARDAPDAYRERSRVSTAVASVRQEHHFREGERLGVRDRDERTPHAEARRMFGRGAVQLQSWRPAATDDLNVLPDDPARVSRAERFHRSFLRREPAGEVGHGKAAPCAILDLSGRKHAPREPFAVALQHVVDARELGRVEANPDDGHSASPA